VAAWAASFAGSTVSWLVFLAGLSIVPFITFYLLRDWDELVAGAAALLPRRSAPLLARRFAAIDDALASFVQGQVAVGAILTGIYVLGLWVSGVQLAVLIGVIAGFGNLVPYLGTGIGLALALASVGLHWDGVGPLVGVLVTFGVGQALEGFVITPRIVGEQVGLSPVAVIVAILAFGEVFGFIGILLAVPSAAILKVVLEVVVARYRKTRLYLGDAAP
jgi:predicted PurR-regulated permease PerM